VHNVGVRPGQAFRFEEEAVHTIHGNVPKWISNRDGNHVFWFEGTESAWSALYDGVAGPPFDDIGSLPGEELLVLSANGRRIAYIGQRAGRSFVGVDGREDQTFDIIDQAIPPTFSPDGLHLAYRAYVSGAPRLVVDGELSSDEPMLQAAPVFSPDGKRLAFVTGDTERDPPSRVRVVLDGVPGPWVRGIPGVDDSLMFSPDSRRFAYASIDDEENVRMMVDGVAGPPLRAAGFPTFSPDGRRFVYAGTFDRGMALVEEGSPGPLFELVAFPIFSPDSRHLTYAGTRAKERLVLVLDGEIGPEYADMWGPLAFSPDSRHVAYLALRQSGGLLRRGKWVSVVAGRTGEAEFDEVGDGPSYSPEGDRVAFSARRGRAWHIVVNDEPGPPYDAVFWHRFSTSGRLSYLARAGARLSVVVDGETGPFVEEISGHIARRATATAFDPFGPDGHRVAWLGRIGDRWSPIVDGTVGPAYDDVQPPVFVNDRTVLFWAVRGDQIIRVTASPVSPTA